MSIIITAYESWNFDNFTQSDFTKFKIIGTPSASRIEANVEGLPDGVVIRIVLFGSFSDQTVSSAQALSDFSGNDTFTRTEIFLNQMLVQVNQASPAIPVSKTAIKGSYEEFVGNDTFVGSTAADDGDVMVGFGGDDTFYPNSDGGVSSYDYVHGGPGSDLVVYRGPKSQYAIVTAELPEGNSTAQGYRVTDSVAGRDGSDGLLYVERLRFSDLDVSLDTSGNSGQAYRIYKAAFDRTPDATGLGYWIDQMDKGMNVVEVAARFIDSPEFRQLYGSNISNAAFITNVYNNVLDRNPDDAGLTWWVNEMTTNPSKTWQKVLADFSESAENKANVASLIANGIAYDPWEG